MGYHPVPATATEMGIIHVTSEGVHIAAPVAKNDSDAANTVWMSKLYSEQITFTLHADDAFVSENELTTSLDGSEGSTMIT